MILAVFDCMVFLQAATNRHGAAGACLTMVEQRHVKLFLSPAVLAEICDVLHRPAIRKAFPKLTDANVADFIDWLRELADMIEHVPSVHHLPRHPDDEPYLNLAIATHASFLVSRDQDLLSLMDDKAFCDTFPTLSIVDPPTFLGQARAQIAREPGSAP